MGFYLKHARRNESARKPSRLSHRASRRYTESLMTDNINRTTLCQALHKQMLKHVAYADLFFTSDDAKLFAKVPGGLLEVYVHVIGYEASNYFDIIVEYDDISKAKAKEIIDDEKKANPTLSNKALYDNAVQFQINWRYSPTAVQDVINSDMDMSDFAEVINRAFQVAKTSDANLKSACGL